MATTQASVLVVEDDPFISQLVCQVLEMGGYGVMAAADGRAGVKLFFDRRPDLVVLDVNMPEMDGWGVLERIREMSDTPILMLTAESSEMDRVRGLRGGADDYVVKPFGRQELVARVEALLRRPRRAGDGDAPDVYIDPVLTVDHSQRVASAGGDELTLTPQEFKMLAAFARSPRQVLSQDQLIDMVWGEPFVEASQVKLLVGRLRRKLAGTDADGLIETVRGFGYRYQAPR